jgi:CBS-domain-containing membrane protein
MEPKNSLKAKFKRLWKHYIGQSLLAASVLLAIVWILGKDKMVVASAIGATSFIVFAMPKSVSAQPRNVIGGHLVGLAAGGIFYYINLPYTIEYALVVALAIFFMVALDVEHPPAAGTALAVVIKEVTLDAFAAILLSAAVLSLCRYLLRDRLKDLV